MALAGGFLARAYPSNRGPGAFAVDILLGALLAIPLIVPFRIPHDIVEVAFIPFFVNLVGAGWVVLGAALAPRPCISEDCERIGVVVPALALGAMLLIFQCVLRPGIAF
jgi:hypothetical protein